MFDISVHVLYITGQKLTSVHSQGVKMLMFYPSRPIVRHLPLTDFLHELLIRLPKMAKEIGVIIYMDNLQGINGATVDVDGQTLPVSFEPTDGWKTGDIQLRYLC